MFKRVLSSRAIIGEFFRTLNQGVGAMWVPDLAMRFDSDQDSETYAWLGQAPAMREWLGGRQAHGQREFEYTIRNKKYEATMDISLDDIRRDKSSQVMLRTRELAQRTNAHWAKLLSTLIINGESTLCYDGQYFFDTDHSEGDSGTQSNDLTVDVSALPTAVHGSTTAPSVGEAALVVLKGIETILSFVDDQGEPMNEDATNFLVMVPTSLLTPYSSAATQQFMAQGEQNVLVSGNNYTVKVVSNARLNSSWTDKVMVARTDAETKPFIAQEEEGVTMSAKAEGSEYEHDEDRHQYGVKALRNVGYGFWQDAVLLQMV